VSSEELIFRFFLETLTFSGVIKQSTSQDKKIEKFLRHGFFRRKFLVFAEKLGVYKKFQNRYNQLPSTLLASNINKKTRARACLQT